LAPSRVARDGGGVRCREEELAVLILFIILWGMAVGWIAHLLVRGGRPVAWGTTLVVGLAGSFVGGLLGSLLAGEGLQLRPAGILGSVVGAVLLLLV
jgi:uncharacterized membrane protein YeaQ/YmgE (transglycosylase-associated protein family)